MTSDEALPDRLRDKAGVSASDRLPGLSVIVTGDGLAALESLVHQTIATGLFEVIVVVDRTRVVPAPKDITVRVIRLTGRDPWRERNAGLDAARHRYVTLVDASDSVDPEYLEALLAAAGPATLAQAPVDGRAPGDGLRLVDAGKAVPAAVAAAVRFDSGLGGAATEVFWETVRVRGGLRTEIAGSDASYRTSGEPLGQERAEPDAEQHIEAAARLEALLAQAHDAARPVLLERISQHARAVNAYLRRHPDEHARIAARLDHHKLAHMPYAELNAGLARELVIAYAFPPYADTSAVVMGKRVRARGVVVDVVSNAMDRIREVDPSTLRIAGPFVDRRVAVPTPTYFSSWDSMEKFAVEGLRAVEAWGERNQPYERIYSRAQFAASHFLAAAYKLANPEVAWVAEFSDPLARDVRDRERGTPVKDGPLLTALRGGLRDRGLAVPPSENCFVWCEELAYVLADQLVFTNTRQLDYMMSYCTRPELAEIVRAKAAITPHPTLPPAFYRMADPDYALEPGLAHLAYFGNFYATRGMDDVLRAFGALDPEVRRRLRLHIFTPGTQDLLARAADLGVEECVRVESYVRYLDFLALTTRFDCLIVNDASTGDSHGGNPYLPSKWSDYRGSATAVWGICEAGSTLSEQDLAYASPIGDVPAAAEVLAKLAAQVSR